MRAVCEACDLSVPVEDVFAFDCRCAGCDGVLALADDDGVTDPPVADLPPPGWEPPTKADSDPDPYARLAAQILGDTRTDDAPPVPAPGRTIAYAQGGRGGPPEPPYRRPASRPPQPRPTLLFGTPAEAPPLPSWDGGDTLEVHNLATSTPDVAAAPPVELGDELGKLTRRFLSTGKLDDSRALRGGADAAPPEAGSGGAPGAAKGGEEEVEQLVVGKTSGRGSRTYERGEVLPAGASAQRPPAATPLRATPPAPGAGAAPIASAPADAGGSSSGSLFGEDPDWFALIDQSLPEGAPEDKESQRKIIHLPESAAPKSDTDAAQLELLQRAVKNLAEGRPLDDQGGRAHEANDEVARDPESAAAPPRRGTDERTHKLTRGVPSGEALEVAPGLPDEVTRKFPRDGAGRVALPPDDRTQKFGPGEDATRKFVAGQADPDDTQRGWTGGEAASEETHAAAPPRREAGGAETPTPAEGGSPKRVVEEFRHQDLDPALVCARDAGSPEADYFRQLFQRIFHARNGSSPRTVLVTSPRAGAGKTTIAANLSIVGARMPGGGAVLIDADPRGGGVLRAFGVRVSTDGLLEALQTETDPKRYVLQFNLGTLDVVPLGIRSSDAAELIASERMTRFLTEVRGAYPDSVVIVDGSFVLHSADPLALARVVDGVVLVVRAGQTSGEEVTEAVEKLGPERVLGVVLNDAVAA